MGTITQLLALRKSANSAKANLAAVVHQVVTAAEGPVPRPKSKGSALGSKASSKASKKGTKSKASSRAPSTIEVAEGEDAVLEPTETGMTAFCVGLGFLGLK